MEQTPKIVFLHFPKAGGTSLRKWLSHVVALGDICPELHDRLADWDEIKLNAYRLFSGHFHYRSLCRIQGPVILLTVLREPTDRLLSWYYFARSHTRQHIEARAPELRPAKTLGLEEFLRRHGSAYGNEMVRLLGGGDTALARARLEAFAAIGLLEQLDDTLAIFAKILNTEKWPITRENPTGPRVGQLAFEPEEPVREEITPAIRDLLLACTAEDRALYQAGKSLFEQMKRGLGEPRPSGSRAPG